MSRKLASPSDGLPRCPDHGEVEAVARCKSCGRGLCDLCFRFTLDDSPGCARCAYEATTRPQRRVSLAVAFVGAAAGGGFWLSRRYQLWPEHAVALGLGGLLTVGLATWLALTARQGKQITVGPRDAGEDVPASDRGYTQHPYRAGARRVLSAVAPRVSGKATAAVTLGSMAAAAVLWPTALHLPRWVEVEVVVASWWVVMATTLTVLLFRGFRLRDDLVYFSPWDRPKAGAAKKGGSSSSGSSWGCSSLDGCNGLDGCGSVDGEGAVVLLVVALALGAAFGAAWVVVEIALPVLFFVFYAMLMRVIRLAAGSKRGCAGHLGKSLGWAALWATVYVVPIALVTWVVHVAHRH